jgi:hypothetical protein
LPDFAFSCLVFTKKKQSSVDEQNGNRNHNASHCA